jgi:AcrR family transcriptional regulator
MPSKSRNLSAEERRTVTIEAVVELAAEQNPGDITTAAIARQMNLTQGALFRHFPTKDAIWQAVISWVAERLLERVDRAIETGGSPLSALEAVFMTHVEFVAAYPGAPRMIFGELQRAEDTASKRLVRELLRCYSGRLVRLIEAGKAQGVLAPEVDTAASAIHFIGTIQGLVMQSLLAGNAELILTQAPAAFALYSRAIRSNQ